MSFKEDLEKDATEHGVGRGGRFTFAEGKNRVRILTKPQGHTSQFEDKTTGEMKPVTKFLCYVLNRKNNEIELAFFPYKFASGVADLEDNELVDWNGTFPMPFDVTITVEDPGKMSVVYGAVLPTKSAELTDAELQLFAAAKPIEKVREALKAKQGPVKATQREMAPPYNLDDIPDFGNE